MIPLSISSRAHADYLNIPKTSNSHSWLGHAAFEYHFFQYKVSLISDLIFSKFLPHLLKPLVYRVPVTHKYLSLLYNLGLLQLPQYHPHYMHGGSTFDFQWKFLYFVLKPFHPNQVLSFYMLTCFLVVSFYTPNIY